MVNHLRTLLLNSKPSIVAGLTGIYIDPAFKPVTLPPTLVGVERLLFPSDFSLLKKLDLVDQLCGLLHTGELATYMLRFDARITYSIEPLWNVMDLCQSVAAGNAASTALTDCIKRLTESATAGTWSSSLFHWPEESQYATDLTELARAWNSRSEGLLSYGAFVLAYVYQLEKARRLDGL